MTPDANDLNSLIFEVVLVELLHSLTLPDVSTLLLDAFLADPEEYNGRCRAPLS